MKEARKIDSMKVRKYCIKKNFYTRGDNKAYENLLFNLCKTKHATLGRIEKIAADILMHSSWEMECKMAGCDYEELLTHVMSDIINECCVSVIVK